MSHPKLYWTLSIISAYLAFSPIRSIAGEPWIADPALVKKLSASQPQFNYDESRVPTFTLPDPLKFENGSLVSKPSEWNARREETIELFRAHVFGRQPKIEYQVRFDSLKERTELFGIGATGRAFQIVISSGDESYSFPMMVFFPNSLALTNKPAKQEINKSDSHSGKFPAVIHINNRGVPSFETACSVDDEFWPIKDIVARGYVACAVSTMAIDPDRANGFTEGLRGFFHRASGDQELPSKDAWKALSAWGWGASRALDYLLTCDQVDGSKVALIGHSRGGKAALWGAAEDTRFAVVCSNNSGCGGAALSRRALGETVARITKSFPHWFCDRFSEYGGNESSLPVDQHQLIALIAPRAVYATSAADDLWADPRGEYLSMVEASPVFKLFGDDALSNQTMPALNEPRIEGKMGYHIRPGVHGLMRYDWMKYLDFCDIQFTETAKR